MRARTWWPSCLVLVLVTAPALTVAAEPRALVRPYDAHGIISPHFSEAIRRRQGQAFDIEFSNKRRFRGVTIVSSGTNVLLKASKNRLIRLAPEDWLRSTIPSYEKGHRLLAGAKVPVPRLYREESDPAEYLVLQHLPVQFTHAEMPANLSPQLRAHLDDQLVEFMKTTWQFRSIGDFGAHQLGWVGDRWVLLDMTGAHVPLRLSDPSTAQHAISSTQSVRGLWRLSSALSERVDRAVAQRRIEALTQEHLPLISGAEHDLPDEIEAW